MMCKSIRDNMVAFLTGELDSNKRDKVENHCFDCSACRRELEDLKSLFAMADILKPEMEEAAASVDWDFLPERIADRLPPKPQRGSSSRRPRIWSILGQPGLRPVMAGVFIGVLVGAMAMLVFLRSPQNDPTSAGIMVPQGFLERVELEMARRDTIDYLEQSEYLLLDFVQSGTRTHQKFWGSDSSVRRTQDLLSKKKYINSQLDKYSMSKAKAICDQIEILFYELAQLRDELDETEMKMLRSYIEQRQILLKIKLVRKELEQSEV
jgi:hypothetical protein